jgi:hypothetical protein
MVTGELRKQWLLSDRRELEEVSAENNTQPSEKHVAVYWKDLTESLVDPTKYMQPNHAFLVNDEISNTSELGL